MKSKENKTLQHQLSPMHIWAIAFGCIIGWGSFVNPGKKFLPNSGVAGTAIAMLLGALVMVVIAVSYYYYITGSTLTAVKSCTKYITYTNGLLPAGNYAFGADGKMILD